MLRIESPPSGKHLWAILTPECHPFAFSRPSWKVVQFNLSLPRWRFLKQLTLVAAGAIASRVSGLSVVSPQVQRCKRFNSGRIASGHLPLVHTHTHTHTDNYNLSIMIVTGSYIDPFSSCGVYWQELQRGRRVQVVSCRLPCIIWIPGHQCSQKYHKIHDIIVKITIIFGQQSILAKSSIKNNKLLDTNQLYIKQQF